MGLARRRIAIAAAVLGVSALASNAGAASDTTGKTTLQQTIVRSGPDRPFDRFVLGRGEPRRTRAELGRPLAGRTGRRISLIYFNHFSDTQLADEESPARVEALDPTTDPAPFAAAWRPQEALGTFATDRAIDQINRFVRSPVRAGDGSRARLENMVITGDAVDNMQRNEAEWLLTLLEGGVVNPNSGTNGNPGVSPGGPGLDLHGRAGLRRLRRDARLLGPRPPGRAVRIVAAAGRA